MASKEKGRNKDQIMLRYTLILVAIIIVAVAVVWRLFSTTVIYREQWQQKAMDIISQEATVDPERGKILADDRSVLATNVTFYQPRIDLRAEGINKDTLEKYLPALADSLAAMMKNRTAPEWEDYIWEAYQNRNSIRGARSFPLGTRLTYEQLLRLKSFPFISKGRRHTGFYYEPISRRFNPYGAMARRSIGRVGYDSIKGRQAGISGLESALDSMLYGTPGKARRTQFTTGIGFYEQQPAVQGYDVMTTINVVLQEIVDQELTNICQETNADWGTAVLMEVSTGKIKAISNLERNEKTGQYVESVNYAVMGFEPGSVMKPISMMVALEDSIITDVNEIIVTGHSFAYAGGRPITDSHGAASMPAHSVIAYSSNIGMAKIILRKYESQPGMFHHRLREMGFFDPLNIGIRGERIPVVDSVGNKNWDRIQLSRMAYGYSTLLPPICTLTMYNAMANGGKYVRPRLVERFIREGEPDSIVPLSYIREQVCSPENAAKLRQMLYEVVHDPHGTGKSLKNNIVALAGKTGTCYVNQPGQGYTAKKRLSFCGFFPYENPQYSCIVVMQGANRGAAGSSGRVLKNVALKMYSLGLLGDRPDYHSADGDGGKQPSLYATVSDKKSRQDMAKQLGLANFRSLKTPATETPQGQVPDVIGLGAREAVAIIENAGYRVKLNGSGYVVAQKLAADSLNGKRSVVELKLKI